MVSFGGSQFLGGKLFTKYQWHVHIAITAFCKIESWGINSTGYKKILAKPFNS